MTDGVDLVSELARRVAEGPIHRVRVLAWRDLEDPEAGGSELHMDEILRRWAAAGLAIDVRTSAVPGRPSRVRRHGYFVERRGGRYQVFPQVVWRGWRHDRHDYDALFEIWNGVPFLAPIWFHGARLTLVHHVHESMWKMSLPAPLDRLGWWIEHRLSPIFYHGGLVTVSRSSAEEIRDMLGVRRVAVVPNGISPFFSPGGERSPSPLVLAVGRLVTVKAFDELIDQFVRVHASVPEARFVIVGEGYLRDQLESQLERTEASTYVTLAGRVSDEELRDLYRRAWLVTSASHREGWGMSLTEAAACGTPAVVVDIAGHRDSVRDGVSGLLVPRGDALGDMIVEIISDPTRRAELSRGALEVARELSWDSAALQLFELLVDGVS